MGVVGGVLARFIKVAMVSSIGDICIVSGSLFLKLFPKTWRIEYSSK